MRSLVAAASAPALPATSRAADPEIGPLRADPRRLLDLPDGYRYNIVSRAGATMSDGLSVPYAHDGMAAFAGADGKIILVCNHELEPAYFARSGLAPSFDDLPEHIRQKVYDPSSGRTELEYLSLAGTELNCAGGPTPWGSWLSCEECFESPGRDWSVGRIVRRDRPHGYVFEVPAGHRGLVDPVPIKAMGRFEHEAAAVHEATGIVYMTEDRHHSLFYRYLPNVPGRLHEGGRLQALAIDGRPSLPTHNWARHPRIGAGESLPAYWIDLDNVDPIENDLRLRGAAAGAATFARGEGLCTAGDALVFTRSSPTNRAAGKDRRWKRTSRDACRCLPKPRPIRSCATRTT
jgi:secreted PhoX family phosphatase